jgi:hypothetical protein
MKKMMIIIALCTASGAMSMDTAASKTEQQKSEPKKLSFKTDSQDDDAEAVAVVPHVNIVPRALGSLPSSGSQSGKKPVSNLNALVKHVGQERLNNSLGKNPEKRRSDSLNK